MGSRTSPSTELLKGIKVKPGCSVGEPKAKGGLMHLTVEGRWPEAVSYIRPPGALGFTTAAWHVLMAIIAGKISFLCSIFLENRL